MLKKFAAFAAILALVVAVPAFAGGEQCAGMKCSHSTTAWAGACLQRSASGAVTVAEVAAGSPAAKAGLQAGDIVTAVNGYRLADSHERASCSANARCSVGSTVTYTIQRGSATKDFKVALVRMPAGAAEKFSKRAASFDPALAALVMPASR